MNLATQIALTVTPLSAYFYVLGILHGCRGPRMIPGPLDSALLAAGVSGLVTFGPFGQAVMGRVVGSGAGPIHWSLWVVLLAAWSWVFVASAARRLAVYNVRSDDLDRAVREALGPRFLATLSGYEDPERGTGVLVRSSPRLRAGSVETYGRDPETLLIELRPRLRAALARINHPSSRVSAGMFGAACLVMFVPLALFFSTNPRAKEALRTLLQTLRWW